MSRISPLPHAGEGPEASEIVMKSALLIIDIQNALCVGQYAAYDIHAVVDRVNKVSAQARAAGAPVVLIQHEDDGPMRFGSEHWQLFERLDVQADDLRIRKTACDAFYRTGLQAMLASMGVDQLVVCGLQSEYCVDSTVRGALAQGYPVTLISDAHSTLDNGVLSAAQISAHHTVTLANLDSYGVRVTAVKAHHARIGA